MNGHKSAADGNVRDLGAFFSTLRNPMKSGRCVADMFGHAFRSRSRLCLGNFFCQRFWMVGSNRFKIALSLVQSAKMECENSVASREISSFDSLLGIGRSTPLEKRQHLQPSECSSPSSRNSYVYDAIVKLLELEDGREKEKG